MRLPGNLRDAAVLAVELGLAASSTELTVRGLRDALKAFARRAVLDADFRSYPNRLRIDDVALGALATNDAVDIRSSLAVSVVDAHLGAVLGSTAGPHAVLTSDVDDLRRIAKRLGVGPTVLAL